MHDLLVGGGIATPKRKDPINDYYFTYGMRCNGRSTFISAAKKICEIISQRQTSYYTFKELDTLLDKLSSFYFVAPISGDQYSRASRYHKKSDMLARYLAWFCNKSELYWPVELVTQEELDQIIAQTISGKTMWEFSCFTSQETPKTRNNSNAKTTTTSVGNSNTAGDGQPKNPYKSLGPLSGKCLGLLGAPGNKITLSSPIFCICEADSSTRAIVSETTAYIRPYDAYTMERCQVQTGGSAVNRVFVGSAKGYGYCQVFFSDVVDADNFLMLLKNRFTVGSGKELVVAQKSAQSNGYFKFMTEFGPVYVSAAKLNEDLIEDYEEATDETQLTEEDHKELAEQHGYYLDKKELAEAMLAD